MKEKSGRVYFFRTLLGTLDASLLGNMLAGKGVVGSRYNNKHNGVMRTG